MMKKIIAITFLLFLTACNPAPLKMGVTTIERADHAKVTFKTTFAQTDAQQEKGLMYVKQMPDDAGMLFIFDKMRPLKFWMHNTVIPLDMLFFNADKQLIYIVENAKPYDDTAVGPDADSMYVLEINGGTARAKDIQVGDRLDYKIER